MKKNCQGNGHIKAKHGAYFQGALNYNLTCSRGNACSPYQLSPKFMSPHLSADRCPDKIKDTFKTAISNDILNLDREAVAKFKVQFPISPAESGDHVM